MTNYEILGIPETATLEEIKSAYRANVKQYHPDVNSAPNAAVMFRLVEQAYRELMQGQAVPPPTWEAPPEREAPPPPTWQQAAPSESTQRPPEPPSYTAPHTPPPSVQQRGAAARRVALRLLYHFLTLLSSILHFGAPFIVRFFKFFRRITALLTLIVGVVSVLADTWVNGNIFNTLGPFIILYLVFFALGFGAKHSTNWLDAKAQKLDYLTRQTSGR